MRLNRAKFIRKYLRFFRVVFNLVPRYNVSFASLYLPIICTSILTFHIKPVLIQIILDGNFIFGAIKFHVDIEERLRKLLQNEIKLFILRSSIQELEGLGKLNISHHFIAPKHYSTIIHAPVPKVRKHPHPLLSLDRSVRS